MELKDFVSESLNQICEGIKESKARNVTEYIYKERVNREDGSGYDLDKTIKTSPIAPDFIHDEHNPKENGGRIDFDIAVTITDNDKLNAIGEINLKIAKGDIEKESSVKTENIHRINFSIPFYPHLLK